MQEPQTGRIELKWLLQAYSLFNNKDSFFIRPKNAIPTNYFFNKLVGNSELMQQLQQGKTEEQIRNSWQPKLQAFKKARKKYLLYPDFE